MSRKAWKTAIAVSLVAAALVASNFTTTTAQVPPASEKALTRVLEGTYRVSLECNFPDETGYSVTTEQVKRIEFHPEYIVIIDQNEAGRVVPVHSLKQLNWQPS